MTRVDSIEMDAGYKAVRRGDVAEEFWSRHDPSHSRSIPLTVIKERLLQTKEADDMPNGLVLQLLRQADRNHDGYITYEEFMQYAESSSKHSSARETFNRATLSVVPRGERTVEKRSYLQEYKCCPPALFMITASLIEIAVFVYYCIDMDVPGTPNGPPPVYSPLIYNPFKRFEAWRYLTYALIHSGYMHLVMQVFLGLLLELVHGWWRVGLIYMAGVLAGSLSHSISAPKMYVAGASGGVYAITYSHVGNLLMNWSEMEFRWIQLVLCLTLTIADVAYALWDSYGSSNPSNTGHMAHLGGAIAGMLVGINILRNLKRRRWEKFLWWVAFFVYLAMVVTGIVLNCVLPVPDFFPDNDYTEEASLKDLFLNSLPK
ncbi:rhomboid-related protein 2-like isoform X2 [Homarus americanus]|uniref:rhomboid-related protein 2-like isoform X2 n=1 Tax=Homarus americanus TaxID=6706 RepID=UPI001C46A6D6|nr:rhomboid-related protein 2-like isoform X2 [Homarus americanus]